MTSRRRPPGDLEAEVLATLWASDIPLTATEIRGAIGGHLAHTTVQTILTRLAGKGAVAREQVGKAHAYSPVLNSSGLAARQMRALLERGDDHAEVLAHFVGSLTAEDEDTLSRVLRLPSVTTGGSTGVGSGDKTGAGSDHD
jgi:predicted transcriptional regulator